MPSSKRLIQAYRRLNRRWFANTLPTDTIVAWADMGDMGAQWPAGDQHPTRQVVHINRKLQPWPTAWEETLLHEMLHVATDTERAAHGPRWLRLRAKLYKRGAFLPYI